MTDEELVLYFNSLKLAKLESKHTDSSKDRNTACGLNVRRRLQCARLYNFKCYSNSSSTEQPKTFAIATIDCASAF